MGPLTGPQVAPQRYLTNRVSHAVADADGDLATRHDQVTTAYSYDPHGNVEWLVHDLPVIGPQTVAYEYDLISGRVLKVRYNEGRSDQFYHRYNYDSDGRLLGAETSTDGVVWDRDARYQYYAHGPLKRTLLGEDRVQGIDHTYTLQGWLKGMNSPTLGNYDVAHDGYANNTGRDAFGMMLTYFQNDFTRTSSPFYSSVPPSYTALYNGNIAQWAFNSVRPEQGGNCNGVPTFPQGPQAPLAFNYRYDKLNRIKSQSSLNPTNSPEFSADAWNTSYNYDPNGNILKLIRKDQCGTIMEAMDYRYQDLTIDVTANTLYNPLHERSNRLSSLIEGIDGQGDDLAEQHTYTYDKVGQLTNESWNNQGNTIRWTPYGKVAEVDLFDGGHLRFTYDAAGHRVMKAHVSSLANGLTQAPAPTDVFTYYVLDAQGNPLATYRRTFDNSGGQLLDETRLEEHLLYGSARLGTDHASDLLVRLARWDGNNTSTLLALPVPTKSEQRQLDLARAWTNGASMAMITPHHTAPGNPTSYPSNSTPAVWATNTANLHRSEDLDGQTLFTALVAKMNYLGGQGSGCQLRDRNGDLMWNSWGINAAWNTVTLSCPVPNAPQRHYLFTVGTDGKVYVHTIDLSLQGITAGEVVAKNVPLDGLAGYGRGMALLQDHTGQAHTVLYLKRMVNGADLLMTLDVDAYAQGAPNALAQLASVPAGGFGRNGLLQVSPDGAQLAMTSAQGSGLGFFGWSNAKIHLFHLAPDHASATLAGSYSAPDRRITSIDFSPGGNQVYYCASGLILGIGTSTLARMSTTTYTSSPVLGAGGDVRRSGHYDSNNDWQAEMLYASVPSGTLYRITNADAPTPTVSASGTVVGLLPTLGLQPVVQYRQTNPYARTVGNKRFELTDHLGNVRVVVSDRKLTNYNGTLTPPTSFEAEVLASNDHYPFGALLPGRNYSSGSYRYLFQGQEHDDEINGSAGTSYAFEYRIHDPRIGRFLSIDPLAAKYPFYSPYAFSGNRVIDMVELEGLEPEITSDKLKAMGVQNSAWGFGARGNENTGWQQDINGQNYQTYKCADCYTSAGNKQGTGLAGNELVWGKAPALATGTQGTTDDPVGGDVTPADAPVLGVPNAGNVQPPPAPGQPVMPAMRPAFVGGLLNGQAAFSDPDQARADIQPVVDWMNNNPDARITLLGGVGFPSPPSGINLGSSNAVWAQPDPTTPGQPLSAVGLARAQLVRQTMIGMGVAPDRLWIGLGSVAGTTRGRVVTPVLRR